jgi:hypothetical protein
VPTAQDEQGDRAARQRRLHLSVVPCLHRGVVELHLNLGHPDAMSLSTNDANKVTEIRILKGFGKGKGKKKPDTE